MWLRRVERRSGRAARQAARGGKAREVSMASLEITTGVVAAALREEARVLLPEAGRPTRQITLVVWRGEGGGGRFMECARVMMMRMNRMRIMVAGVIEGAG